MSRIFEPSTYAGFGLLSFGVSNLFEALTGPSIPDIGTTIMQAVPHFATGNWVVGGVSLLAGLASVFLREKGGYTRPQRQQRPPYENWQQQPPRSNYNQQRRY